MSPAERALGNKMLVEAARRSLDHDEKVIHLGELKTAKLIDLQKIGVDWQSKGYGRLITEDDGYNKHYHFSLSSMGFQAAHATRKALERRSIGYKFAHFRWDAVSAIASVIAAAAAGVAAYFSYVSSGLN